MAKEADDSAEKQDKKAQTQSSGGGSGGIVKLLILIMLIGALGTAGFVGYTMFLKPQATEPAVAAPVADPAGGQTAPVPRSASAEPGPIVAYAPFLVNLADPGGNRYLKLTLSLELSKDKNFPVEVTAKEPKIKDIIISILSSKTYDEISTTQGKIAMKQEILRRLNTIMSGGRIMDVYITEFVVQ